MEPAAPTPPAPSPAPPAWRRGLGLTGRAVLWLPGVLLGTVLAGVAALWLWAGTEGSLAQALGWARQWQATNAPQAGQLQTDGVRGNLVSGGSIDRLAWSRDGLRVQADTVQVDLGPAFWLAALRGAVHLPRLQVGVLRIEDTRAATADAAPVPPEALTLPLPVDASVTVDRIEIAGERPVALTELRARYRYGSAEPSLGVADAHTLELASLAVAGGRYRAQATLGAQTPLPLRLQVRGTLQAAVPDGQRLDLQALATAQGTLAGAGALLDLTAQIAPVGASDATPTLAGTARVRPWAAQPVAEADLRLHRLDTALLWPTAPVTALSGTVQARPDGADWRAALRLTNDAAGPLDRQRLPVRRLQADLVHSGTRWTLSRLEADIGDARVQASGQRDAPTRADASVLGAWQGRLEARGLNPAQLWSRLAPAALDARLSARAVDPDATHPAIDIDLRVEPAGRQPRASALASLRLREAHLRGRWQPAGGGTGRGALQIDEARVDALDATLDARGRLDTVDRRFEGAWALDLPGARARWQGSAAPARGNGDLALDLGDAARLLAWVRTLDALPVAGPRIAQALAAQPGLRADGSASARLRWQGGLGALGWGDAADAPLSLDADLSVPRLALQRNGADGAPEGGTLAEARLRIVGPVQRLALSLQARADHAGWRVALDTAGHAEPATGPLRIEAGLLRLDRLRAVATQGLDSPRVTDWTLDASGPLQLRWRADGAAPLVLIEPAAAQLRPVVRGREGTAPAPLTVSWDRLRWEAGALQTRGRLQGLPLAWVDALGPAPPGQPGPLARAGLGGDIVFDGDWDMALPADAGTTPRLNAHLQRRSGDLAVQTEGAFDDNAPARQRVQAGVRAARIDIDSAGRRLQARLRWDSERFGELAADIETELAPPDASHAGWHWPATAPLNGTARARLPQVGVWSVLAPPGWRVRGTLQADATLGGTRDAPRWGGTLLARELALRSLVNGVAFNNGELRATLAGERIVIERFTLEGRGGAERGGTLQASGSAEWRRVTRDGVARREPLIELQASANALRVSSRADRRLTVTGALRARLDGPALQLRGQLRADEALLVLPDERAPSLGSDVVVRGTEYPIEPAQGLRVVPDVQVELDLGERFEIRGEGLQARLNGRLTVRNAPGQATPSVLGEVRTASGSYRAYGQQLGIETGVVRFSGAYDNPALDITAVRPNTAQRVGVQITGTANAPRVRLFSDPELPDSEKLAWLVLGRPASGAGAEAAVLQQAALALLAGSDGGPLDGGLAGALGLDTLSFSGTGNAGSDGGTASAALTLGKRLSDNLYLSYERSLAGTLNTVSVFYDVSRRFTLRARAGSENAVDLIFTLQYD